MADFQPLRITGADGCWLTTDDGRRLLDGVASLWCNVHGHRNAKIDDAVRKQLDRVAHITTLGMSADVTDRLAEKLAEITPGDLSHVFFSCDGSSAVEAALKMAFQYWQQRRDARPEKTKFLALSSAYHGDTTGSVSLGGIKYFHQLFAPILFTPVRGPAPCTYRLPADVSPDQACKYYVDQMRTIIASEHESLAAVVMEPLVQGAAGMITHPVGFLKAVRRVCDEYDVLLICDEVAVGFGRTGRLFACQQESVTPDILCLGKGLTGGYLPMAATVARPEIYDAFLGKSSDLKQFFHGHTYGGNPLAAAAALASIDLIETTSTIAEVDAKSDRLRSRIASLADHPHVGDIRGRGLMLGIELVADKESKQAFSPELQVGRRVCEAAIERAVWLRPLSDVVVAMPPLVINDKEIDLLADVLIDSIESVCRDLPIAAVA